MISVKEVLGCVLRRHDDLFILNIDKAFYPILIIINQLCPFKTTVMMLRHSDPSALQLQYDINPMPYPVNPPH
jgi:hypothetical protein